jgi:hypothetical protein
VRITSIFRVKISQARNQRAEGGQSIQIRSTQRYIPEDGNIHNCRCENPKPCSGLLVCADSNKNVLETPQQVMTNGCMDMRAKLPTSYDSGNPFPCATEEACQVCNETN